MNGLVVIGASYAGIQAALTARAAGYAEPVTMIAEERAPPYQRPPLSKDFLLDEISAQALLMHDEAIFSDNRIELCLGDRVVGIDRTAGRVVLAGGAVLDFERLVIATGSRARRIAVRGAELDGVCYLRSIADAADPLYKTLDDNQKRRLSMLTHMEGRGFGAEGWRRHRLERGMDRWEHGGRGFDHDRFDRDDGPDQDRSGRL